MRVARFSGPSDSPPPAASAPSEEEVRDQVDRGDPKVVITDDGAQARLTVTLDDDALARARVETMLERDGDRWLIAEDSRFITPPADASERGAD